MTRFETATPVDFVVIGAGAAGGVVAKELSTAGFQVVVLEQGPYLRAEEFEHDELKKKRIWSPPYIGQDVLTNDHSLQPNTFRKTAKDKAVVAPAVQYGRCVGGGSVHFTANYWRFHEIDFVERSRFGPIEGTGFADWPITYADLEPYYTKAESDLGISGLAGANPFDPPRSRPYPLPPLPVKSSGVLMDKGAQKLGWHSFPAPLAILSQPYRGRNVCHHCGYCIFFGCEWGAKSSTLASVIPMAEETGRCEVRTGCYVRKISTDKAGRVDGAIYFDSQRHEQFQKAKAVVLCANGAETPRLLLLSKSNLFPDGLANSNGLVGKYLMFDCDSGANGIFEHPLNEYKSVVVTRVIHDFYDSDPKRGFYGGGGMDARLEAYPIEYALFSTPPGTPKWGAGFKRSLQENYNRQLMILTHLTTLALESNTITLDPEVKDAWGLPAMRVTYKNHPDDLKNMAFFSDRALELLDAAGAQKKWAIEPQETTASVHLMGTCRMGNDPKASVVDKYHRAHDVPNLFIVDGSSFVTSGRNQPTCTIQALAYRASDYIGRMAKSGTIG
ncbi:MAG TPA: GMC family oxidoreductase [Terriglobales bacterium]|jgi:choline dehydrogenase-like flavoprotein|nr:GMC family oxidoreductase [Terriglobales bacterium]